jgi:hypothetical protein
MAADGQNFAQIPHKVHFSLLFWIPWFSVKCNAETGQTATQPAHLAHLSLLIDHVIDQIFSRNDINALFFTNRW